MTAVADPESDNADDEGNEGADQHSLVLVVHWWRVRTSAAGTFRAVEQFRPQFRRFARGDCSDCSTASTDSRAVVGCTRVQPTGST